MFLAANSSSSFVVELSQYNRPHEDNPEKDADGCIPCRCKFSSNEALIPDTSGYSVAVLGWSISSAESLAFTEPDLDDTGVPYPMITFAEGVDQYDEKTQTHTPIEVKYEKTTMHKKSHNFAGLCKMLSPDAKDLRIMHPTSGGGLVFRNDGSDQTKFKSVTFSKRMCDRFRLHNAPVERRRDLTTSNDGHLFEVLNWAGGYQKDVLSQTEAMGQISQVANTGATELHVVFSEPLWPDAVPGTYEYENLEYTIFDVDWFENPMVATDARQLATFGTISVDAGGNFTGVFMLRDALTVQINPGTQFVCEQPVIKELWRTVIEVLFPDVPVKNVWFTTDTDEFGNEKRVNSLILSRQNFDKIRGVLTPSQLAAVPLVVSQPVETGVVRLTGTTDAHEDVVRYPELRHMNGKRLVLRGVAVLPFESDADEVEITWSSTSITNSDGSETECPNALGNAGNYVTHTAGLRVSQLGAAPGERGPRLVKPFEMMYLINRGRKNRRDASSVEDNGDPHFDNSGFEDFRWQNLWDGNNNGVIGVRDINVRGIAFHQAYASLAAYYSVTGPGFVNRDTMVRNCKRLFQALQAKIEAGLLPGAPELLEEDFIIGSTELKQHVEITQGMVQDTVAHSTFEASITLVELYQRKKHIEGRNSMIPAYFYVVQVPVDADQRAMILQFPGQSIKLDYGGEFAYGYVTFVGTNSVTCVVEPEAHTNFSDMDWQYVDDEVDMSVSIGHSNGPVNDIYKLLRDQGLDDPEQFEVVADRAIRLYPGDSVESFASADDQQHYSRIAITSQDLLVQPVISSGFRSLLLHSFPLPHKYGGSCDTDFQMTSVNAGILGTIHWRDKGGESLPHPLQMGSASLRHFAISAAVLPRNTNQLESHQIRLPPGGLFQVTLCFCKDFTAK